VPLVVAPPPAPDQHVRQLRAEVARAEVAELQEALAAAVQSELDVIARTAAVRERLRSAQSSLSELERPPAVDPERGDVIDPE
jgi:hypothetical protein